MGALQLFVFVSRLLRKRDDGRSARSPSGPERAVAGATALGTGLTES